jgi:hypothetical protein
MPENVIVSGRMQNPDRSICSRGFVTIYLLVGTTRTLVKQFVTLVDGTFQVPLPPNDVNSYYDVYVKVNSNTSRSPILQPSVVNS